MSGFCKIYSQFFPPKPTFTEKNLPSLRGKVYLVSGSNTGVGKEVAQILYSKGAKVYIAARSKDKALKAIEEIKSKYAASAGQLVFLRLDLADLTTIKASAEEFIAKEKKLHVLFNNAGLQAPPAGSKSAQGYELQLGVNNVGTFMLTKLLTPVLAATAKTESPGTVRVVWVSSAGAELGSPQGGVEMDNLDYHKDISQMNKYSVSKAGNYLQSTEFARRHKQDNIVSVALNPGNLKSDLYRHQSFMFSLLLGPLLHPPIFGAYTEIFAGLSPEITMEKSGSWIAPWGRFMSIRKDLQDASKPVGEGGTGIAKQFWEWNEDQVKSYL